MQLGSYVHAVFSLSGGNRGKIYLLNRLKPLEGSLSSEYD